MTSKKLCGIYRIIFPNGKNYIGQSKDINERFKKHYRASHPEKYHRKNYKVSLLPVHRAMKKYETTYCLQVIEKYDEERLDKKEIYWIKRFHSDISENGYNVASGGQQNFALKRERHSQAKLTEKQVNEIKVLIEKRELTFRKIAEKYNVSPATITLINTGVNWHDKDRKYPITENCTNDVLARKSLKEKRKFSYDEIQTIKEMRSKGNTLSEIQRHFNNRCSLVLLSQICLNKIYNNF